MTMIEKLARIIDPDAWQRRECFQEIIRGEGRQPDDPEQRAMYLRSATRRVDTVVARSLETARAVLTALREPDEGMLHAVDDEDADPIVARGRAYSAWTSMIDHILQEADRD